MNTIGIVALSVAGLIVVVSGGWILGAAMGIVALPFSKITSQIQMNQDIQNKTYNADNALYNYHWFQETAAQLTAYQQNITATQVEVADFKASANKDESTWSYAETQQYANLQTTLLGQEQEYNNLAQEYNAKAGEADRSIFVNGLPLIFNLKPIVPQL